MTKNSHKLLLGAHMSISGGLEKAIERGESIGCTAIQIFTKSNRQWHAKKLTQDQIDLFIKTARSSSITAIVAHASYLINVGSPSIQVSNKSTTALALELERCELLKIPTLVLHPGSSLGGDETECLERIAENLDRAFEAMQGETKIALETMAGQGSGTCHTFEHIAYIYKQSSHKKRLGVCFDTCHAFSSGYDISTREGYEQTWKQFDDAIGIDKLLAIHVNDSKKPLNARVDRHEHIGKGKIGLEAFRLLFNDKRFYDIPKILETPKDADLAEDRHNMDTLESLLSSATCKALNWSK